VIAEAITFLNNGPELARFWVEGKADRVALARGEGALVGAILVEVLDTCARQGFDADVPGRTPPT
jgi:hypothetical protein